MKQDYPINMKIIRLNYKIKFYSHGNKNQLIYTFSLINPTSSC